MDHIDLSRGADAIVVAPASADFLAKVANGHADDLLSTLALARDCPLLSWLRDEPADVGEPRRINAISRDSRPTVSWYSTRDRRASLRRVRRRAHAGAGGNSGARHRMGTTEDHRWQALCC
jgi:hypothetical protein